MTTRTEDLRASLEAVRAAQRRLGAARADRRTAALHQLARLLDERRETILEENRADLELARSNDLSGPLLHRLALTPAKIDTLIEGVGQLAVADDPVGRARSRVELDAGLELAQVDSPLGVLLVIFESRPDAVIQIGSLALRSGNGVVLKGGSEAIRSNRALVACLRDALSASELSAEAVLGVEGREAIQGLLELDDLIDLVIPRGSSALVRSIQTSTRIPVLGHAEGICHLYVDDDADPSMAARIAVDGKCDYPAACNATETLLIHRDALGALALIGEALVEAGVELRADPRARAHLPGALEASDQDWAAEHGDLILSIRTVDSIDEAIEHIHRFGSAHTDAIVTDDPDAAERFLREVDSASVFHNASTRFADGYRYGLGAEVGISTSRIHARGPVGVAGLLTTRWLLRGAGQRVGDYGPGGRSFTHRPLPIDDDPSR